MITLVNDTVYFSRSSSKKLNLNGRDWYGDRHVLICIAGLCQLWKGDDRQCGTVVESCGVTLNTFERYVYDTTEYNKERDIDGIADSFSYEELYYI